MAKTRSLSSSSSLQGPLPFKSSVLRTSQGLLKIVAIALLLACGPDPTPPPAVDASIDLPDPNLEAVTEARPPGSRARRALKASDE